jgi:hypothetical protein
MLLCGLCAFQIQTDLLLDGREVKSGVYSVPGCIHWNRRRCSPGATATNEIGVDHTFFAPGDARALGIVLRSVGFAR